MNAQDVNKRLKDLAEGDLVLVAFQRQSGRLRSIVGKFTREAGDYYGFTIEPEHTYFVYRGIELSPQKRKGVTFNQDSEKNGYHTIVHLERLATEIDLNYKLLDAMFTKTLQDDVRTGKWKRIE
ncbi:MAG: hypothetical protein Q7R96_05605 [Nanoarchaeota archaeon]|nr:hypothetical protein [Nanoarchaeota archaeon]